MKRESAGKSLKNERVVYHVCNRCGHHKALKPKGLLGQYRLKCCRCGLKVF